MQDRYQRLSLWGRSSECGALDQVIAELRTGRSQVLVLRGPAGIGKTALLDYLAGGASGCQLVQTAGIESEMELAYAGLHQFCGPMLGSLERLPDPQRDALRVAFGLRTGPPPDRFMVGLAVLGLLAEAAEEHAQVCVVDDAQWLDRASAEILGFVARRLLAERVALVFAVRDELDAKLLPRLPELIIGGLSDGAARSFLDALTHGPLDEHVIDRIVAETRGNPLALIEFTRGLSPEQLAGGFGLPDSMPLAAGIEQRFARRYQALPPETRQLLLAAAADPTGDVTLLWSVASRLGIGMEAGGAAENEGLIEIGPRARFCHPLARSAVYRSASADERRTIHRALAQVTDPLLEPDRRAWHLAQAAAGPDEAAALELERSAKRAHARGGAAAAAAFLERASSLTPEPGLRSQRALAAAAAKRDAGALNAALALLVAVEHGAPDKRRKAEVWRLRGHIALDLQHGGDASRLLLKAARELEPLDSALARETHLEALAAAMWAVGLDGGDEVLLESARAARAAPPAPHPSRPVDVLLDALAARFTEGFVAAAPTLIRAVAALRGQSADRDAGRWQWAAGNNVTGIIALEVFDSEARHMLGVEQVEAARDVGSLAQLQVGLHYLAHTNLPAGELAAAASQIDESRSISDATGNRPVAYSELALAAFRGREAEASALITEIARTAADNGQGRIVSFATYASAVLYNGIGRYEAARDAALLVIDRDVVGYGSLVVAELAEAASRTGDIGLVEHALAWIRQRTSAAPTEWSRGIESRIRALLSRGDEADQFYRESIALLGATRLRAEEARGHLLYGEWLRRERRRVDARKQLGIAHDRLTAMGLDGFARRALDELQATGATARKRSSPAREQLTAQEEHVARLASQGLSNPEIGVQLFLSARTVEWHMSRVFTKLGIHSRVELRAALAANGETTTSLPWPGTRTGSERRCPVTRRQDPVGRTRDSRVRPVLCWRRLGVTGAIRPRATC